MGNHRKYHNHHLEGDFAVSYKIIEKTNRLAVHALCDTIEGARRWIAINAVEYCRKGYFMDKTLTPDSFEIVGADTTAD